MGVEKQVNDTNKRVKGEEELIHGIEQSGVKVTADANRLRDTIKTLEANCEKCEEKANQREASYKDQIKTLTAKLKQAEARAEFAERSVQKLQKEVDRLEDELMSEQEKLKAITE